MEVSNRARDFSSVDRVMNRVLAAEREARDAVERCRAEAVQILAGAEEETRRIAHRAERRLALAHRIADRMVEGAVRALREREREPRAGSLQADTRALLTRAMDDLLDEILSAKP